MKIQATSVAEDEMTCKVSLATKEDAESVAKISHQTALIHQKNKPDVFKKSGFEESLEYIKNNIDKENVKIFKAEKDKVICGYLVMYLNQYPASLFVYPKFGFIGGMGVDEKFRRQGIGRALIRAAEDYLKAHDIPAMELDVFTFNKCAEKLYDSLGYQTIKTYKRKILK